MPVFCLFSTSRPHINLGGVNQSIQSIDQSTGSYWFAQSGSDVADCLRQASSETATTPTATAAVGGHHHHHGHHHHGHPVNQLLAATPPHVGPHHGPPMLHSPQGHSASPQTSQQQQQQSPTTSALSEWSSGSHNPTGSAHCLINQSINHSFIDVSC